MRSARSWATPAKGRPPPAPLQSAPLSLRKLQARTSRGFRTPLMRQTHKEIPVRSCDTFPVRKMFLLILLLVFCAFAQAAASGQTTGRAPATDQRREQQSTVIFPETRQPVPTARPSEAACGGLIEQ